MSLTRKPTMLDEFRTELNEVYSQQLQDLLINQHIFRQLDDAWKRNADRRIALDLQFFMWQCYLAFACTAVRRMVDSDARSRSLRRCLEQLRTPEALALLSRSEYVKLYPENIPADIRNRDYDRITKGRPELTAQIIDDDINAI